MKREKGAMMMVALCIAVSVVVSVLAFSTGSTSAHFANNMTSNTSLLTTWNSSIWTQTTQADFEAGVLEGTNTTAIPGSVVLNTRGPCIYATTGGSTNFFLYNVTTNRWVTMPATPSSVG